MTKLALSTAAILVLCSSARTQDYRYQSLHLAGAVESYAHDINNDNVVVGTFLDEFDFTHGFIWDDGRYDTPILELDDIFFNGINDAGTVVGAGVDLLELTFPSFILLGEELTAFEHPEAALTFADGINNQGEVVGDFVRTFEAALGAEEEPFQSFHRNESGEFVELSFPGFAEVLAIDINNHGQIVGGVYDDEFVQSGFIFDDEGFRVFNHPDGETELLAINDHGAMVGSVFDGDTLRPFVFDEGGFRDFAFPGAAETTVWSINNQGVVVGEFMPDGGENYRAFIAFPVPEPNSCLLAFSSMVSLVGLRRRH